MPRLPRRLVLLGSGALLACATLAGCGSSLAAFSGTYPTVGGTAVAPTLSFPDTQPPSTLHVHVLVKGHGPVVQKGDMMVVNYVGQIWRGKVFDSSFSRNTPASFQIGVHKVIPGWDTALVGQRVGSRLLLLIPPAEGYGPKGQSQAGITGTDTITFLVDILGTFSRTAAARGPHPPIATSVKGIKITWGSTGVPTVHAAAGTVHVHAPSVTVLTAGSGAHIRAGLVVLQYVVVDLATGKVVQSTWESMPDVEPVGGTAAASVLTKLIGLHSGTRMLLLVPKNTSGGPYAIVGEVVAAFPST